MVLWGCEHPSANENRSNTNIAPRAILAKFPVEQVQSTVREHILLYHQRVAPCPHWYLVVLGVKPCQQGRGLARALLEPMLARADAGSHLV